MRLSRRQRTAEAVVRPTPTLRLTCRAMKRTGRTFLVLIALGLILGLAASPALAQEEAENTDAGVTGEMEEPAVVISDDAPVEPVADWTYRYLIPTTLALGAIIILGTSVRYFTNVVRQRYRTVEE